MQNMSDVERKNEVKKGERIINKYNAEHYHDSTVADAVAKADRQPKNVNRFIRVMKRCAKTWIRDSRQDGSER